MMMQPIAGADAGARLVRALIAHGIAHGVCAELIEIAGQRWASATFEGMRHKLTLSCAAGEDGDRWFAALPEAQLVLRGHVVAELTVEHRRGVVDRVHATLAVLTLADA